MKKQFSSNHEWKCGQLREEIRLCSLILIYTVHKSFLCRQQRVIVYDLTIAMLVTSGDIDEKFRCSDVFI